MYIRCADCKASTWVEPEAGRTDVVCKSCGREWKLNREVAAANEREIYEDALRLADANGFDVATAYSVLFGIMPLEAGEAAGAPAEGSSASPHADPDAAPAQGKSGKPALAQVGRSASGNRSGATKPADQEHVGRAALLATEHGLSMDVALRVAQNEVGLKTALLCTKGSATAADPPASPRRARRIPRQHVILVSVVFVLALAGITWNAQRQWSGYVARASKIAPESTPEFTPIPAPEPVPATRTSSAEALALAGAKIERDADGRVVRVEAATPAAVLTAYCHALTQAEPCDPVELAEPLPRNPQLRVGLFVSLDDVSQPFGIVIRRTPRRWQAGDGDSPISRAPAERYVLDAARTPVPPPSPAALASLDR